jgi:hypothetical protein
MLLSTVFLTQHSANRDATSLCVRIGKGLCLTLVTGQLSRSRLSSREQIYLTLVRGIRETFLKCV